jgi:hypothetical protein
MHDLVDSSLTGLNSFLAEGSLDAPASYRLAFREFGLSIGLHAAERTGQLVRRQPKPFREERGLQGVLEALHKYLPVADRIETFWLKDIHSASRTWKDHRDINMVMLATTLAPDGYLTI